MRPILFLCVLLSLAVCPLFADPIKLSVDATAASKGMLSARLTIPVTSGDVTLVYPKWLPGDHSPSGQITNLVGLQFTCEGKSLAWKRDDVDLYAFHITAPEGAKSIEADLRFILKPDDSATTKLFILSWNNVVLYPQGAKADDIEISADVKLPARWEFATVLPTRDAKNLSSFKTVSLTTLVDSPLIAGEHFKMYVLDDNEPKHFLSVVADSADAVALPDEFIDDQKQLVAEAAALFGAKHFGQYHFLLALSDHIAHFGLEHHESSDNRSAESDVSDENERRVTSALLAHEYVHSWCGKHRRPAGLATPDFQQPMKTESLWVYEGLTECLGQILPIRAGAADAEYFREYLAMVAAKLDHRTGRTWRSLRDTARSAPFLYDAPESFANLRRGTDFYDEGLLLWLDVDAKLRALSENHRTLDDFCKKFFGGDNTGPTVKTFVDKDVYAALNQIAAFDWEKFFNERLDSHSPNAPLGGIAGLGWKLVYTDESNAAGSSAEGTDVLFSLGFAAGSDGTVTDVIEGMPADKAGVCPGMRIIAVDNRRFATNRLISAVDAATESKAPIELIVEHTEFFKTIQIDYHEGLKYPHLERDSSKPDWLNEVLLPRAKENVIVRPGH